MSDFTFPCPACREKISCDESFRGAQFPCPACSCLIIAPSLAHANRPATPGRIANGAAPRPRPRPRGNSWLATFFFNLFLGGLGVDRFYNGRIGLGIGKLLTGGLCGLWSLIDCLLLLFGKYQDAQGNALRPARRSHVTIALSVLGLIIVGNLIAAGVVVHQVKSALAEFKLEPRKAAGDGFESPEAVVEAMKTRTGGDAILVVSPEERPFIACLALVAVSLETAFQPDASKREQGKQALETLVQKYDLANATNLPEMENDTESKAAATRAFANVDLVQFMSDLENFSRQYGSQDSIMAEFNKAVSVQGLNIQGNKARGTLVCSDGTTEPVVFTQTAAGWFLSLEESEGSAPEPTVRTTHKRKTPRPDLNLGNLTLDQLEQQVELHPNDPHARYELGAKRCAYGQWDAAIDDLLIAFDLCKKDPASPNLKAEVLTDDRFSSLLRERPYFSDSLTRQ